MYLKFSSPPPGAGGDAAGREAAPAAVGCGRPPGGDVTAAVRVHTSRTDVTGQRGGPATGAV